MLKSALSWTVFLAVSYVSAHEESSAAKRALPIFQVVEFPNENCDGGGSRNGTCYTAEECSNKGGTNGGSCASGYGVCCVFALNCGSMTSENGTYLVSSTSDPSDCHYDVCKCNENVCRIRFDFNAFTIAGPTEGTVMATGGTAETTNGGAIGDCTTDSFAVTAPGGVGSPVICGVNSGYHMIVDASDDCHRASFMLDDTSSVTRNWEIRVTQYMCGDEDIAGPAGCLQYYTGTSNTIQNFNFPVSGTTVPVTTTHLSNQQYDICIRRASGFCHICYSPTITATAPAQNSFGLGVSGADSSSKSVINTDCADYIAIPFGTDATIASIALPAVQTTHTHRFCGRQLNIADANAATATVCSRVLPFRIGVNFDDNEATTGAMDESTNELTGFPGGIIGFKLTYWQVAC